MEEHTGCWQLAFGNGGELPAEESFEADAFGIRGGGKKTRQPGTAACRVGASRSCWCACCLLTPELSLTRLVKKISATDDECIS